MLVKAKQAKSWMRLTLGLCLLGLVATAAQQFGGESLAVAKSWSRITSPQDSVGEVRQLKLSSTSAAPGSEANLPLTFSADGTESRIHFSLRFPANSLLKPRIALTDELSSSGAQLAVNDSLLAQGKLGLEINLPVGVTLTKGDHKILNVRFTIARQTGTAALPVEFSDEPVARSVWNDKAQSVSTGFVSAVVTSAPGLEGDVAPRPQNGNGTLSVADWAQVGRFAAGLDSLNEGSEFQRTDCAPRGAAGDGQLNIADWVQAGRYAAGLDAPTMAGGPSAPVASIAATASTLAPEQQGRVMRVVPATLTRGQQGNVALELTSQGNEFAVGFTLNFDPTQLAFVRAVAGSDATGASLIVNSNDAANGRIVFNLSLPFGQKFAAGARQVGVVTFTVRETSTLNSTTLSFSNGSVVDELATTLATTFTAGVVTLTPTISQTPALTSLSPSTITVNSGNLTLTVNGANLIDGSLVRVNGQERATQYITASQLRATLQSTDAEEPGSLSITVRTPDNVVTNALVLNVVNPAPTITSINPSSATLNSSGFAMTVTGTNFVPGAVVKVGATNRITNVQSSTQITVQIPSSALNTAGTFDVTVTNPAPGGGTSNAVPFTVSAPKPIPRIASISPTSKQGGTGAFTLTVNGSGYVNESIVRWNGQDRVTTFVNGTQLTAAITAEDIATAGTASVTVYNSPPGGGISAAQTFTITQPPNPVPVLTTLNPTTITAGGAGFTLTLLGSNFVQNSIIRIGGQDRQTTFVSATELRTAIAAAEVANGGSLLVRVFNPTPGGGLSVELPLTINFAPPAITSISPSQVVAGGPAFTLTVVGTNFATGTVVRWNGENRPTTITSVTELTAQIPAADIANIGSARVSVFNTNGTSSEAPFTITQALRPVPRLTSLTPSTIEAGKAAFTLTVTGTNFVTDSVVRWNGQPRQTGFANSTQLTAQISAADIANLGIAQVTVYTPPAGGGESNPLPFSITTPPNSVPAITSLSPSAIATGTNGAILTVNGTGYVASSVVRFNGEARPTTFVSATQLTAQLSAGDLATSGTVAIVVTNPSPGGGASNAVTLNVANPVPVITSLNPNVLSEGGSAISLTVIGTNFVTGAQILVNGQPRLTSFANATQVSTQITAADQATATTLNIQVSNPAPGGGVSNIAQLPVRKRNAIPRIVSLNPTSATAGANGLALLVTGANFVQGSVVRWNGADRPTDFSSDTLLVAQIPASDLAAGSNVSITVFNPAPGGGTSGGVAFQVVNPAPRITSINPDSATAGGGAVTLIVNGANFVANSSVRFNSVDVATSFVTSSQLSAQVPASAIASGGVYGVSVFNPAPGGGTAGSLNFTVTNPVPNVTQLLPEKISAGSPTFILSVVGTGFVPSSVVRWNGQDRQTMYVAPSQLTAVIPASDLTQQGTAQVSVFNTAPGGGASGALNFAITLDPNPLPTLSALTPNTAFVGAQAFTLIVTGTGYIGSSRVQWNGSDRPTTFVSATQLTAQISVTDLVNTGVVTVTVVNPPGAGGGGGASNSLSFNVLEQPAPAPVVTSVTPNSIIAGGAGGNGIALQINGTGFTANSQGRWNDSPRPTTFVSATQLSLQLASADLAAPGNGAVNVVNAATTGGGGGVSNSVGVRINPTPVAQIIVIPTGPTTDDEVTLQLSGQWHNGCVPMNPQFTLVGNEIRINTSNPGQVCTTAITPWSLPVVLGRLPAPGEYTVRVIHASPEGVAEIGRLAFVVGNGKPILNAIAPRQVLTGSIAFTLTVTGSGFAPGATVLLNGSPRETTFVRSSSLAALITEADLVQGGLYNITVVNPPINGVGGGVSNAVPLAINNPIPQIIFLNPGRVSVGSDAFTLTVTGLGFVNGSVVRWNGVNRLTTRVDSMTLTIRVSAQDLAAQATVELTVFNPEPAGGLSAPLSLVIEPPSSCQAACFQSPQYYLSNLNSLPSGQIYIGGVNFNAPINIQGATSDIRRALTGGRSVMQALNAEYVAAQLSVLRSAQTTGILNGTLRCYGLNLDPIDLTNGYVITVDSTLAELFAQSRSSMTESRPTDQLRLAQTLDLLNGNNPNSRCGIASIVVPDER